MDMTTKNKSTFEVFSDCLQRLYLGHLEMITRVHSLSRCKRRIFELKMIYWEQQIKKILLNILDSNTNKIKLKCPDEKIKDYIIKNQLVQQNLSHFFFDFHKQFSKSYVEFINNLLLDDSISDKEKMQKVVEELLEILNITIIELQGLNISCCVFSESEEECIKFNNSTCIDCSGCYDCKDSDGVIMLRVIPEYFQFDNVFDKLIESFTRIKQKDKVILIVSYKLMCNRLHYYNWEEMGAYERYKKVQPYFKKIYFYQYQSCVDFGQFEEQFEKNGQLIKNKQELLEMIDNWRVENGQQPKYNKVQINSLPEQNKI